MSPSEAGHSSCAGISASGRVYRITYTTNALHAFDSIVTQGINATPRQCLYRVAGERRRPSRYRIELE
ncbi:MAG: hypothetical protein M9935_09810 [Kiritimatiellae bacterium]|nr:hypothetical protein [Kiritimatiellia bacterium]